MAQAKVARGRAVVTAKAAKTAKPQRAAPDAHATAVWVKAKRLYADLGVKVSEIAELVDLSSIELSNEAKRLGWPMRGQTKSGQAAAPATASKSAAVPTKRRIKSKSKRKSKPAPKPIVLVRRVYNTIDGELTKLEQQAGASSQDRERASRALSQMVNSLEKAVEMQREITKDTTKGGGQKDKEALAHAEDLRREIAERVERLQRKRALGKRPE